MTIRKKMSLILLACAILPMCFVGILGYYHARNTLESLRLEGLKSIADLKAARIEEFFREQKKHISVAQQRPTLKRSCTMLAEFSGDFSSPIYEAIRMQLDQALGIYKPVYEYRNVILANPEGRIVYVLDRISAPGLLGRAIPDLWRKVFAEGRNGIQFSDIYASKTETGQFSLFFTAPIESNAGQHVGVAAFEIDMAPIYDLIQNTAGLGETGETLVVQKSGNQALFLNPLRHDPDAALRRTVDFGGGQAIPVQEALNGNNGYGTSVDYRGREVIAAWRYLPLPGWGLVTKIDIAENFKPVTALRDFVLAIAITVIILSVLVAFIISKSISEPIQVLTQGVVEIGRGNLDYKVGIQTQDDIGQLGRAFDQMSEKLKQITASRDELNREIGERKKAETALRLTRFSIDNADEMIYWTDSNGDIIDVNTTTCNRLGYSKEELLSMHIDQVDPSIQMDEYKRIWQKFAKNDGLKLETVRHTKEGESIPVEIHFNYIQFNGREYNCAFARDISERKIAEIELQKMVKALGERVKELNCLFEISRIIEDDMLSLDDILQLIIDLIPPAWQFPDSTCAKIQLNGKEIQTHNYKETIWQQVSDIIVHGVPSGRLMVNYLPEMPESDSGSFLKEEQFLLDTIAERVGRMVERKWMREALVESEERFRELMENMHSGVAVVEAIAAGEDFELKDCNRRLGEIEKVDRERIIGSKVTEVFPTIKEIGLFDVFKRVWKTGTPEYFSGSVYPNHGASPHWREGYVYRLSSGEIVSIYQDVTEQKLAHKALEKSEQRFRDLVENSLTGISIVQNNQVVYQNQEQERLLGPIPRAYIFADDELIYSGDVEKVRQLRQKLASGEFERLETTFGFYPADTNRDRENLRWVHCRTVLTEYRNKEAILVNMVDITNAKKLEQLLAIQDKMASLGRVAAGIAHEIRNPLSGINIYLNTLKKLHHKTGSEEKVKQILAQIQSASRKIESVIRRVMDFAKPGEPKFTLIDLNQPVTEAINLCAVTMRKSGVEIKKALSENLPLCKADPDLMEAMVLNLINNAAEAMKTNENGKKIVITSSRETDHIVLTVSDSGPGVAPEIQDNIFDPYFTTKSDGTGIGLSLCHRIVRDHGGNLAVAESQMGGAEFRVEIPVKKRIA